MEGVWEEGWDKGWEAYGRRAGGGGEGGGRATCSTTWKSCCQGGTGLCGQSSDRVRAEGSPKNPRAAYVCIMPHKQLS